MGSIDLILQKDILLILHFAVKMKDDMQSSEDTYLVSGHTQNKISQYLNNKCAMPRASRISLAQHIMHSLKIKGETYKWLDNLTVKQLDNVYVKELIDYIEKNKRLASPRGRTDNMAKQILKVYKEITR